MENRYKIVREDFEFTKGGYRLTQEKLAEIFISKGYTSLNGNAIRKIETDKRNVSLYEIKGYCEVFNTTSDYLLGIRDTKPVDENLAMVSKYTGLSDASLKLLKKASKEEKAVLNAFVETSLKIVTGMTQDFYDDLGGKLIYNGREMSKEVSEEFEESLFIQRLRNVFHSITHNRKVTDLFMQLKAKKYIEKIDQAGFSKETADTLKSAATEVLKADLNGGAYDRLMKKAEKERTDKE